MTNTINGLSSVVVVINKAPWLWIYPALGLLPSLSCSFHWFVMAGVTGFPGSLKTSKLHAGLIELFGKLLNNYCRYERERGKRKKPITNRKWLHSVRHLTSFQNIDLCSIQTLSWHTLSIEHVQRLDLLFFSCYYLINESSYLKRTGSQFKSA